MQRCAAASRGRSSAIFTRSRRHQEDARGTCARLDGALAWLTCFDVVQLNEDEMAQLGSEPLALAAARWSAGVGAVC